VLLRGINVGPNKRIPMPRLRALLTGLGFENVRTHLQSGNAVVTAPEEAPARLAARIEDAIEREFGFPVRCIVRTRDEMAAVVAGHPLADVADNGSRMMALFLSERPDPQLAAEHDPVALDPDRVRVGEDVVYQWCPDGVLKSPDVSTFLIRNWNVAVTGRNWNTVVKLAELLED
jgi:uncharacterized protein (DUF1697 family)